MTANDNHRSADVSTFELDVYWVSGQPDGTDLARHVVGCARCQAYLARLGGAPPLSVAAPSSVRSVPAWVFPAAGVLALAASVILFGRGPSTRAGSYVAMKGMPAVELLVQREQGIGRWDERTPVHPGDRLAIRVACEGLARVAVAAPDGESWGRLSETACPATGEPLPFTLVVDDQPGDELLAIVMSRTRLDDVALTQAIRRVDRAGDVWVVKLVLPKTDAAP